MKRATSLAILAATLAAGCGKKGKQQAQAHESMAVKVTRIERGTVIKTAELFGRVSGAHEAQVYSEFPGKLLRYTVKEGRRVAKGQTIALVDRSVPGVQYEPYPVRAPVSGTVAFAYLKDGSAVDARTPIALISGGGDAELSLDVPAGVLASVKPGARVFVLLENDTLEGEVKSVSRAVNPLSGAGTAKVRVRNRSGELLSGMVVRCRVVVAEKKNALSVPAEAVIQRDNRSVIYLIRDGKAHEVPVETGIKADGTVEIRGQVSEGDTVATLGATGLVDGAEVEVLKK